MQSNGRHQKGKNKFTIQLYSRITSIESALLGITASSSWLRTDKKLSIVSWPRYQGLQTNKFINTLRPTQNGRRLPDGTFRCTFLNENIWVSVKIYWSLFLRFKLTIFQHWCRYWLRAGQATSHYLNQWLLLYWRIYASLSLNELR